MSSFSSVVRKGPKVAPRVAPRRNIVRKAPPPAPAPASTSESPIHVESETETAVDPAPPSPPRVREDADTQPSTTIQENAVPSARQHTPDNNGRTLDVVAEPARSVGTPDDSPTEASLREVESAATIEDHAPAINDSQILGEAPTAIPHVQETGPASEAFDDPPQSTIEENVEESRPLQETPEVATDRNEHIQAIPPVNESAPVSTQTPTVQAKLPPRRNRKQPPRASPHVILSQPSISAPSTSPPAQTLPAARSPETRRAISRAPSVSSQQSNAQLPTPENEFDRISSQLQTVQEASAAINARTRSAHRNDSPPIVVSTTTPTPTEDESADPADTARPRKRRKPNRSRARTAEEQAAEVVANALGSTGDKTESASKRPRGGTPEDAEEHEIVPEKTKMGDLCEDRKWGKKSETEKEMAANWEEIIRRRKEDAEERITNAALGSRRKRDRGVAETTNTDAAVVPEVVIQDGNIVVTTRVIDRHADISQRAQDTEGIIIRDDKDIYKRVLATTVGCRNPIAPGQTWDDLSTDLFYTGLKKFGTDFQMISATIPGKTRKQVKLKYNVEERKNWPRVKRCLGMKEEVNLEEYAESTGVQFASVADVYKQMEEDEKRLREEDEQRRRDEGIISQDQDGEGGADGDGDGEADVAIPSIETDAEAAAREIVEAAMGIDRRSTASRVGSTTTARQTAQPTGAKKKQVAKKNAAGTSKKGRAAAAAKNKGFEGVEERIGGIEDVGMSGG